MKLALAITLLTGWSVPFFAQPAEPPKTISDSVARMLRYTESELLSLAEAMPENKYSFVPTAGNFDGVRSFGEQIKHVACGQIAFFNEIEGKTPPEHCEKGGPSKAATKAELVQYLRDSFEYGNRVLATVTAENALTRVDGPYQGPNTRLGLAITAVWHIADHYGQLVPYARMNGIVPPSTSRFPLAVR